jgi:protein involved in polysaccharide export with SLBB domain
VVVYDRPITLIEAITLAGGMETGLFNQNTVELADYGRSFVARGNERLKVDFVALFERGDMSQNIRLLPDDYICLPEANSNQVYILGKVASQGPVGLFAQSSVTSAITVAGGFAPKAYKDRVLLIRGSLEQPKCIIINMNDVLRGREKSTQLEPHDIIYVSEKPWARAEEILGFALRSFTQVAVAAYSSGAINPLITEPLLKVDSDSAP